MADLHESESQPFKTDDEIEESIHYWNYRVCLSFQPVLTEDSEPEEVYDIIEAYYGKTDVIEFWADKVPPMGGSIEELRNDLTAMLQALDKPILLRTDLPGDD